MDIRANGYKKTTGGNVPHLVGAHPAFIVVWGGGKRVRAVQEELASNPEFKRTFKGMPVVILTNPDAAKDASVAEFFVRTCNNSNAYALLLTVPCKMVRAQESSLWNPNVFICLLHKKSWLKFPGSSFLTPIKKSWLKFPDLGGGLFPSRCFLLPGSFSRFLPLPL